MSRSYLIIQTAFTGDAILATSVAEKLHVIDPNASIDMLVRRGNEGLFLNHPFLREVLVWDKKQNKYANLFRVLRKIRKNKYERVINLQRFFSTGFLTAFSSAKIKSGFRKNPLSILFNRKVKHMIGKGIHEVDRNLSLISDIAPGAPAMPRLYPSSADFMNVQKLKHERFVTISPGSVWFTKTFPAYKWIELIEGLNKKEALTFYLIGSREESTLARLIIEKSFEKKVIDLCGKLSLLESAALMKDAEMNYVNDSAPMHLASAMNAPVTAVYCSTVPDFGFGPLSERSRIIETMLPLDCRPCGLHGYRECPLTHFKCAHTIDILSIANS